MRSLVVDDDILNRVFLHRVLSAYGPCLCVASAREAEAAFGLAHQQGEPYDCVFMDIMMPEVDGHEGLEAIRRQERVLGVRPGSEVKAVMITALSDTKTICRSFFDGQATAYITKPIDLGALQSELRAAGLIC